MGVGGFEFSCVGGGKAFPAYPLGFFKTVFPSLRGSPKPHEPQGGFRFRCNELLRRGWSCRFRAWVWVWCLLPDVGRGFWDLGLGLGFF